MKQEKTPQKSLTTSSTSSLRTGINPNARKVNGAVCAFDHGSWVDDVGQHHGRKRSRTCTPLRKELDRGRLRAKIVLNERQLAILELVKRQGSVSRSVVALGVGGKLLSCQASIRTLTRDLTGLVKQGLLIASGKLKHTVYSVVSV
jgi:predicted HTH transcriptional regulator